jgi:hypothetical protein
VNTLYTGEVGAVFKEQWTEQARYETPDEQRKLIKQIYKSKLGGYIGITKTIV